MFINVQGGNILAQPLQTLVERCRQGEEEAWRQLVERLHPQVEGHVLAVLKRYGLDDFIDNHLQDIVNFLWKDLIENIHKYESSDFELWFAYRRVRRVLDYVRKEIRHLPLKYDAEPRELPAASNHRNDPHHRIMSRQLAEKIQMLPTKYALMLRLYYWQGLSYKEIASVLEIKPNSIGSLHVRALRKLGKI